MVLYVLYIHIYIIYIYINIYTYIYTYLYIYIYREREREREILLRPEATTKDKIYLPVKGLYFIEEGSSNCSGMVGGRPVCVGTPRRRWLISPGLEEEWGLCFAAQTQHHHHRTQILLT